MKDIKDNFIPYEEAKELKELGFDGECFGYYKPMKDWMMKGKYSDDKLHFHGPNWSNEDNTMYFMYIQNSFGDRTCTVKNSKFTKAINNIAVPLWQQAFEFFREKHQFFACIRYASSNFPFWFEIEHEDTLHHTSECFNTYEEAQLECLRALIKIFKDGISK